MRVKRVGGGDQYCGRKKRLRNMILMIIIVFHPMVLILIIVIILYKKTCLNCWVDRDGMTCGGEARILSLQKQL